MQYLSISDTNKTMLKWDHSGHQETFNTFNRDTTQSVVEEIYDASLETKVTVFPISASVLKV